MRRRIVLPAAGNKRSPPAFYRWMTHYLVYLARTAVQPTCERLLRSAGLVRADAQRVLRSAFPVPVARVKTREEASGIVRRLRIEGLDGFAITQEALRRFKPTPISRLEIDGGRLVLSADRLHPVRLEAAPESVRFIALGKFHYRTETRTASTTTPPASAGFTYRLLGFPLSSRPFR